MYFDSISLIFVLKINWWQVSVGSSYDVASDRRKVVIWTNCDDLFYRRIHAWPELLASLLFYRCTDMTKIQYILTPSIPNCLQNYNRYIHFWIVSWNWLDRSRRKYNNNYGTHLSHCYHIFRGCVPEMFVTSYSITYCTYVLGKLGIFFHYYCAVYDECK